MVIACILACACFAYGLLAFELAEYAIGLAEAQRGALEHTARGGAGKTPVDNRH
jgi:hypothetical protein